MKPTTEVSNLINTAAFNKGYRDFFNGGRAPLFLTDAVLQDLKRRIMYLNLDNDKAVDITRKYQINGVSITDHVAGGKVVSSTAYKVVEAVCSFKEGTYAAKEWQRGYNAAYFKNLRKDNAGSYASHSRFIPNRRPGK